MSSNSQKLRKSGWIGHALMNKNMSDDTEDSRHTPGETSQKFSYHI